MHGNKEGSLMSMAWEEIMKKCPTMKELVEQKIVEEVAKKQAEIDGLKAQVDELTLLLGDVMLGGL